MSRGVRFKWTGPIVWLQTTTLLLSAAAGCCSWIGWCRITPALAIGWCRITPALAIGWCRFKPTPTNPVAAICNVYLVHHV